VSSWGYVALGYIATVSAIALFVLRTELRIASLRSRLQSKARGR
jgi:hypothetical protein